MESKDGGPRRVPLCNWSSVLILMIGVGLSVLVKYHLSPANFRRLLSFGHLICVVLVMML